MARTKLFRRLYAPAGQPPGDLPAAAFSAEARFSLVAYDAERIERWEGAEAQPRFAEAGEPVDGAAGPVLWLNQECVGEPANAERIGAAMGLHTTLISDLMRVGQRPKYEPFEGGLFVVLRALSLGGDGDVHWEQVGVVAHGRRVWTVQEREGDCLSAILKRLEAGRPRIRSSGPDYFAVMVLDGIVDGYFPVLEALGERLEDLEERMLDEGESDVLEELYHAKRDLVTVRRSAAPVLHGLQQLLREGPEFMSETTVPYLRDVVDHLTELVELTESYRELADSLVDIHLSTVSMRTNEVMQLLAVVSTIFIPLTFIAGVYGMNFDRGQPGNLPELGVAYGYVIFWIACGAMVTALLLCFRRLGWLRLPSSW